MTKKKTDHDDSTDPATGSGRELRRAQAELDAARARYFDFYELAPGGYCTLSEQGLILEANLTTATLLGVARSALVKKALSRFIIREDQDIYFRHHKQLFETGAPQVCELRMLRREGSHFMARVEATAAQDADGRRVCRIVVSDITAPNIIKEAFRRKAKDLQEKNDDLTRFIHAVSHDPQSLPVRSREGPVGILLLEDDPAHAEAVQLAFLDSGMKAVVHWAQNLGDYQALAAAHTPDIAIVDLHLPDGNAVHVLTSPPEAGPFPILIMTGHGDERVAVEAMKAGAIDYVEKSSGAFAAMPRTVERVLHEWGMLQQRKRAEEVLRESEEKYRTLFDNAGEAIFVAQGGKLVLSNPMTARLLGYPSEEIRIRPFTEFIHPDDRNMVVERHLKRLRGEELPAVYSFRILSRDGNTLWVDIRTVLINWEGQAATLNLVSDITDRKRAEETLRRTEENFRRSLDDSPLGVRVMTAADETIYANGELLDFYGYDSVEEFNKIPLQERYTPQSYAEFKLRRKAREQGKVGPREYEIAIVRKNGEIRHLQVFRKEVFWNGEKQFQTLYRDITEEKKRGEVLRQFEATIQGQKTLLEQQSSSVEELIGRLTHSREEVAASYEALKANKDDLVRSEKLAFTGRIAASIAHEIRNPLTNIILSLRQLKKDDKIKPEGLNYAGIMERNSNRIEYLITELLNCARPIKLNLQPWDIHRILKDVLTVHKVRLKTQKIKVIKNLTPHPSILLADKEYLGRVFLNLVANGIEAMGSGGVLSIDTKIEKGCFLIKIKDNGRGIPEKNLIKIFDPFFSTKKQGAGLGLTTCQNIVTSHGGQIEVESAWGKGSVFTVSLPLEPKPSAGEEILKERHDGGTS